MVFIITLLYSVNVCGLRFEVHTALTVTEEYLECDTHRVLLEIYQRFSVTSVNFYHTTRRQHRRKNVFFNVQNVCEMVRD